MGKSQQQENKPKVPIWFQKILSRILPKKEELSPETRLFQQIKDAHNSPNSKSITIQPGADQIGGKFMIIELSAMDYSAVTFGTSGISHSSQTFLVSVFTLKEANVLELSNRAFFVKAGIKKERQGRTINETVTNVSVRQLDIYKHLNNSEVRISRSMSVVKIMHGREQLIDLGLSSITNFYGTKFVEAPEGIVNLLLEQSSSG